MIGDIAHHALVDQLLDQLLAQPLDVHRTARGEMADGLLLLRGAHQPARAACHRLALARSTADPHTGQFSGQRDRARVRARCSSSTRTTCGITSPARRTITVSPAISAEAAHLVHVVQAWRC
jgi:hypothetical protein